MLDAIELCTVTEKLVGSNRIFEGVIGKPVPFFAWPNGNNIIKCHRVAKETGYTSTKRVYRLEKNSPGNSAYFTRQMNLELNCSVEAFR